MININIKVISTIIGIIGSCIIFAMWIFSYHLTLATKQDIAILYVEIRLNDVQDSVFNYQGKVALTDFDKEQLLKLKSTLARLQIQREKLMGFSSD